MKKLFITTKIEWLKIKGLGLLYLAIALGGMIPIFRYIPDFFKHITNIEGQLHYSTLEDSISKWMGSFTMYILLIYIIIAASRIAQIEYKNNCWQLMETQPVSRLQLYASKYIIVLIISYICIASYFLFNIALSVLDYYIHPDPAKILSIDILWMLKTYLRVCVTILGVTAVQLCLSICFSSMIWPFLFGSLGLIINIFSFRIGGKSIFSPYYSLQLFRSADNIRGLNEFISFSEHLSIFWSIVFFICGYFLYSKKGFKNAFLKNKIQIGVSIGFVMIISGIFFLVIKPKPHINNKEGGIVIRGNFQTQQKIDSIWIYSKYFNKKVGAASVQNNQFIWRSPRKLSLDYYNIKFSNKEIPIIMGDGDWFDFTIKFNDWDKSFFMKSNRKAEQSYDNNENFGKTFRDILSKEDPSEDPKEFYKAAKTDWKENIKKIDNYTNAENMSLSNEYKEYRKQILAILYLKEIDNYRISLSKPNFKEGKDFLKDLKRNIHVPSRLLSKDDIYLQYRLDLMLTPKERVSDVEKILFEKIEKLPNNLAKDQLLAEHLSKSIELATDSVSRKNIFSSQIYKVINQDYKNLLYSKFNRINSSQRGAMFPDLLFLDEDGKSAKLSKYLNKYVIIDLWATWCGPCVTIRPIFDRRNMQYKYNDYIQFISISLDESKVKWKNFLKVKPSSVPQYWLPNSSAFMDKFNIDAIPRFIIIDPQGKIFNMHAPFPDGDDFINILDKINH
ncbi:thioredoxin [Chryseobacterium nematophagum]|uniref:Thioredoxin n=1 Tax=Chryseobacterium nematophagum TaxID=2305228 RepID=A0A3M7TCY0_9FLAO|nr:ABC transporter permease [Chryseobacterium nematophagum]RNA61433.1 thioredoxin [Chryseobacterium nematophagum]